jgi:alcohol dehydrogenase (cytochrome c)
MRHFRPAVRFILIAALCGPAAAPGFTPVTDEMLENPAPGDWLMWRRTLNSWGFSPLDQINRDNVRELTLVWTRALAEGIQEGTPLVHDGVMFFPNPGDVVQSFDATTGDLRWEYRRKWPDDLKANIPFPTINRTLALYGTSVIDLSADDFVIALDAATGKPVWETRILDYTVHHSQQSSGPITARGKVISGRNCEPVGIPDACVVTAHDAKTGKELWRRRLIPKPGEAGGDSWGDLPYEARRHVGAWMVPSFDPELNRVFVGTSVTAPAPKYMLAGNDKEYLYHNSTLALDADSGEIVWYYQHLVDHWDLDHPFERLLVDTKVTPDASEVPWINPKLKRGERRKVMTGVPGKTGVVYTLDRETGEFLWARPTIMQTVLAGIDGATGKASVNPDMLFTGVGQTHVVCPSSQGGKNFQAGAYSPLTNTMYYSLQNTCMRATSIAEKPDPKGVYQISVRAQFPKGVDKIGTVHAVSAETGRLAWKYEQRAAMTSLVATGGGLLFGGDANGRFRAFDQKTGQVLWEVNLGSPVTGYPVTFAVNGRQYVAVSTGTAVATTTLNLMAPELKPGAANNLFVFALPVVD